MVNDDFVPSRRQLSYLSLARRVSLQSRCRSRHGSCLVSSGRILNTACNHEGYTGLYPKYWTIHSEVAVCLGVGIENCHGGTIINWRETRDLHVADSKPCPACVAVMRQLGIRQVIYTRKDHGFGRMKL